LSGEVARHLHGNFGFDYTDAKLTNSFVVTTEYGFISGQQGSRLPQSAKVSTGGSLTYDIDLSHNMTLNLTGSANYKGPVIFGLPVTDQPMPYSAGGYTLFNANANLSRGGWSAMAYVDNLTNKRAVSAQFAGDYIDSRANGYFINRPRTIGLRLGYKF
jgi:outer membrane receptor protein involved in Fe transport